MLYEKLYSTNNTVKSEERWNFEEFFFWI